MTQIAGYTLHSIETGRFRLDGGAMFGIVPKPLWERRIPADERNRIPLAMRCLLLRGHERVILIDNGIGDKLSEKMIDIYGVDFREYELRRSLAEQGVTPEDVTDVILTHLHFDHCGGSTRYEGGRLVLTFPHARHYVQRTHWEWATHPNLREKASFIRENILPIQEYGKLVLVDGDIELFPGVHVHVVNGHTRGQQIVRIHDEENTLLFMGDLVPTHAHIPLVWIMAYDIEPLVTLEEKQRWLEEALAGQWHLFLEHDPSIEVINLEEGSRGFQMVHPRALAELHNV